MPILFSFGMLSYIFERSAGTITFAVSIPMKQIARSFLMQLLFWILFFDLARLVFLLYYTGLLRAGHIGPGDVAGVFIHSIRLDLAVACYFMVFPFLILSVQSFWSPRWLNQVNKAYTRSDNLCLFPHGGRGDGNLQGVADKDLLQGAQIPGASVGGLQLG
jgi:hypothetical protein